MDRPVWLLDVDGVLNVPRPGWDGVSRSGDAHCGGKRFRMRWAPALIDRIRGLQRAGTVDIRWCSTWCGDADQLETLFGLPRLGRAWSDTRTGIAAEVAKLTAARRVSARGRRLVWTDDAEVPRSGPVYEELTAGGRALLIAPSPLRGLQPEHLDAIEAFIAAGPVAGRGAAAADALRVARRLLGDDTAL
ncbi:MAG TPA: hypothetical protein VD813_11215 [Pseudonocardia sp.]|nr:hypothetical protein [Pseudonocardia sp.]